MTSSANHVLMVRPAHFAFNEQTAVNNHFQKSPTDSSFEIQRQALLEFDEMVRQLQIAGITVIVIEDSLDPVKPDAIFPNNWISTAADGRIHLYPMFAPNRRSERRQGIVDILERNFQVARVNDWSFLEEQGLFLEGTGSIVFDHSGRVAYAATSARTNETALLLVAAAHNYEAICFEAQDALGRAIYHTNVLLSIGEQFAVGCSAAFVDREQCSLIQNKLRDSGHEWIDISFNEMEAFGANLLQVQNHRGEPIIVLSQAAFDKFQPATLDRLKKYGTLLPVSVPTIERVNGGSVRCMMAEIFLATRQQQSASPLTL
jgi:hypothetical protein